MYGAVLGDIIGSPYEFDRGDKTKDFRLFKRTSHFTDDSIMTLAIAKALLENKDLDIKERLIQSIIHYGKLYPHAGYGARFIHWFDHPVPYESYGNGSAMRVSIVGWLYDTLERTEEVANISASISHNHREGIKGACSVAACIYLARNGYSKEYIKAYIEQKYEYDLNRKLDDIRPYYYHVESCQETVPEAIIAFLEADSFEDTIRNAVSLGGDADTLTCIAGSIAEAFYGVPQELKDECLKRIDPWMVDVLKQFDTIL